jgi:hypothetical protein
MGGAAQDRLKELLLESGLSADTCLYRQTLPEFLSGDAGGQAGGVETISANSSPSEAVVDVYGQGYTCQAEQCGPGLAFVETADNEWQEEGRVLVRVLLRDVLSQGGLVYPVASVITERTWYLTLPSGGVAVRRVP